MKDYQKAFDKAIAEGHNEVYAKAYAEALSGKTKGFFFFEDRARFYADEVTKGVPIEKINKMLDKFIFLDEHEQSRDYRDNEPRRTIWVYFGGIHDNEETRYIYRKAYAEARVLEEKSEEEAARFAKKAVGEFIKIHK